MERVPAYKAKDGKLFEDIKKCLIHEAEIDFREWFEREQEDSDNIGYLNSLTDITGWIKNNSERILPLILLAARGQVYTQVSQEDVLEPNEPYDDMVFEKSSTPECQIGSHCICCGFFTALEKCPRCGRDPINVGDKE